MDLNEYLNNYRFNNKNGIWTKEKYVQLNIPNIWNFINSTILYDISFNEKVYMFANGIKEIPKCSNPACDKNVLFKNRTIGYQDTCSTKCSSIINSYRYNKHNLIKMGYDSNRTANDILKELKIYKIFLDLFNFSNFNNFVYYSIIYTVLWR